MDRRWRKGLTGCAAAAAALAAASSAWAAPTLTPTSGPSGTRVRVTDPACPNRETVSLIRFWAERNAAGDVVSGESPDGGRLVVDGPGTGVLSGPSGRYYLQAQCSAGPGLIPVGLGTRLEFELGDGGGGSAGGGGAGAGAGAGGGSEGGPAAAEEPAPAEAPAAFGPPAEPSRGEVRAAQVALRNEERQGGISARQVERAQERAARAAEREAALDERQAGIEARRQARAEALAERARERSAR